MNLFMYCMCNAILAITSHSGFLEMRLRNIQRKLEAGRRRYIKRKKGCNTGRAANLDVFSLIYCKSTINQVIIAALDRGARAEQDQGESSETGETGE